MAARPQATCKVAGVTARSLTTAPRVAVPPLQIGRHRGVGPQPLGQALPAPGLPGAEQRPDPDLPAQRLDQQPGPPAAQRFRVAVPQLAAQVTIGQYHVGRPLAGRPGREGISTAQEGAGFHAEGPDDDRMFRQPPRRRAGGDLLGRPQGGLARRGAPPPPRTNSPSAPAGPARSRPRPEMPGPGAVHTRRRPVRPSSQGATNS